jgi:peptidoglycan L-alanyl-D-glutamate endopeptidase CwlK
MQQERAFNNGLSKVHYPSYHNCQPVFAVDVAPYEMNHIDWDPKQCLYFNGFVMGIAANLFADKLITHQIFTGMDWDSDHDINDTKFVDAVHFFIKPIPPEVMNFVPGI